MPTLAHLILGGIIGVCLYYISNKKFSKYHILILFLCNYLGPDLGWVLGMGHFSHSYLGWLIFSIILAMPYHYFTKFSIKLKYHKTELIENNEHHLSYLNTFYLVAAGGILHNYLDAIINYRADQFILIPPVGDYNGVTFNLDGFINIWRDGAINANPTIAIIVGFSLLILFIFVFAVYMIKTSKITFLIMVGHVTLFLILYYLLGHGLTLHSDAGAILYLFLYWGVPFMLLTLSTHDFNFPKENFVKKVRSSNIWLYIVAGMFIFLSVLLLCLGIFCLIFQKDIAHFLLGFEGIDQTMIDSVDFFIIGISLLLLSIFGFFIGIYAIFIQRFNVYILITCLWLFLLAILGIILLILGIFLNQAVVVLLFGDYGSGDDSGFMSPEVFGDILLVVGIMHFIISIWCIILILGLIFKNRILWRACILSNLAISFTIIGLVIACYLSKDSVKQYYPSN